jgi:hypothetical protein
LLAVTPAIVDMFTLKRCPKPACAVGGLSFSDLPDDIVILVFAQCQIDELLALRLTGRRAEGLIREYIASIAPSVARSTFPDSERLLLDRPARYSISWLKELIPQQLASILVDRHRIAHNWAQQRYGIPAEDDYGDELRARIANGWRVLRRLSKISQDVYAQPTPGAPRSAASLAHRIIHPSRARIEERQQKEDEILEKRLAYVADMPAQLAKDYKLMSMLLSSVFRTAISNVGEDYKPWVFDWGSGIDGQRLFRKGNSWLAWFVLAEGPGLFWAQWWALPCNDEGVRHHIRERAAEVWQQGNEKMAGYQREHARLVQEAVNKKAEVDRDFAAVNPISYFSQYAECRLAKWQAGIVPARETLGHVPFHVEFRCPEEVIDRYEAVMAERETVRGSQSAR